MSDFFRALHRAVLAVILSIMFEIELRAHYRASKQRPLDALPQKITTFPSFRFLKLSIECIIHSRLSSDSLWRQFIKNSDFFSMPWQRVIWKCLARIHLFFFLEQVVKASDPYG